MTLGAVPRKPSYDPTVVRGQRLGDGLSVAWGAAEYFIGEGMRGGGSVMMVTSCGTLVPVVTAIDTTGAAICTHGIVVMGKALQECSKFNDYEGKKQSGRGDRHTNLKAKDTAQDKCEGAKAALAKHRSENRGKPGFKKEENRLEEKVAHWKRKADATGETHGRKGKGKR